MPKIRPYESQVGSQGELPNQSAQLQDFGGAGLSNLGQGLENLGQSVGQAQRILNQAKSRTEVTDEHVAHIGSVERLTAQVAEHEKSYVAIDPATGRRNPTLSDKMPGLVKAELDQRGLTADGSSVYETQPAQNAFSVHAAQLSQHFVDVARHADGKLAGEAAVNTVNRTTDQLGAHVFAHPVPASVELAMGQAQQLIHDPNGVFAGLPGPHRDTLLRGMQESIATRAVQGAIRQYPNRALEILQQPPEQRDAQFGYIAQYVPNEKITTLLNQAEHEVKSVEVEARQREAEQQRQHVELQHQTDQAVTAQYFLHLDNPGNPKFPMPTATEIAHKMQDGSLSAPVGRAIQSMMEADAKGGSLKKDNEDYWKLFDRLVLPWGDPNKLTSTADIYKAAAQRKLTSTAVKQLVDDFTKARTDEGATIIQQRKQFLDGQKSSITHANPMMGRQDQEGDMLFANFSHYVAKQEALAMKENRDPSDLYDPTSEFYLGKKTAPYLKTMKDSIRSMASNLRRERVGSEPVVPAPSSAPAPSTARQSGESAADYLKRTR